MRRLCPNPAARDRLRWRGRNATPGWGSPAPERPRRGGEKELSSASGYFIPGAPPAVIQSASSFTLNMPKKSLILPLLTALFIGLYFITLTKDAVLCYFCETAVRSYDLFPAKRDGLSTSSDSRSCLWHRRTAFMKICARLKFASDLQQNVFRERPPDQLYCYGHAICEPAR
jgi:hypothetical protein